MFATLGMLAHEERIYRLLLSRSDATAAEVATALRAPPRHIRPLLRVLERKGLVTHSPERTRRYFAVPPDVAVEALIARRQSELQQARQLVTELGVASHAQDADKRLVEIISHETAAQVFSQLRRAARKEVLALQRSPLLVTTGDRPDDVLLQCLERGIVCRTVTESRGLPRHAICESSDSAPERPPRTLVLEPSRQRASAGACAP